MLISNRPIGDQYVNMHALKEPVFNYRHGGGGRGEGWRILGGVIRFSGGNGGVSVVANIIGSLSSQDGNAKEDIDQKNEFLPLSRI